MSDKYIGIGHPDGSNCAYWPCDGNHESGHAPRTRQTTRTDNHDAVITSLRSALARFADAEFYVKEKPVGKKPGIIFNIVELQMFALQSLQEAERLEK